MDKALMREGIKEATPSGMLGVAINQMQRLGNDYCSVPWGAYCRRKTTGTMYRVRTALPC